MKSYGIVVWGSTNWGADSGYNGWYNINVDDWATKTTECSAYAGLLGGI